jgi:hypothetical protein
LFGVDSENVDDAKLLLNDGVFEMLKAVVLAQSSL